jgi:hypothetical protein
MDQEQNLSNPMMERYTMGLLDDIALTQLASI